MSKSLQIYKELKKIKGIEVGRNVPLSRHTTLHIGGPAQILVIPKDAASLSEILTASRGLKRSIIGNGSNLLAPDRGLRGVVIKMARPTKDFSVDGRVVVAPASMLTHRLLMRLAHLGLSGLEFSAGVPAAVGGATFMNMGARGREMARVIDHVEVMDPSGKTFTLGRGDLKFSYRKSNLSDSSYSASG